MTYGRRRWICKAGPHDSPKDWDEDDPVLRKFHYIDKSLISYKRYALNELIKDDTMVLSVNELRDLLKDRFYKVMLEMVITHDNAVVIKIREWCDGDDKDNVVRMVACINQWRCGDVVRKEIIKRLIEGNNAEAFLIPLKVTFLP